VDPRGNWNGITTVATFAALTTFKAVATIATVPSVAALSSINAERLAQLATLLVSPRR
jgi:hypothetical protein